MPLIFTTCTHTQFTSLHLPPHPLSSHIVTAHFFSLHHHPSKPQKSKTVRPSPLVAMHNPLSQVHSLDMNHPRSSDIESREHSFSIKTTKGVCCKVLPQVSYASSCIMQEHSLPWGFRQSMDLTSTFKNQMCVSCGCCFKFARTKCFKRNSFALDCVWPMCVWPTCVWPTCVWPMCVWPTCVWPTCVWPTCVWPTCVWPTCVWPTCVWPTCVWPTCVWRMCV